MFGTDKATEEEEKLNISEFFPLRKLLLPELLVHAPHLRARHYHVKIITSFGKKILHTPLL